MIKKVKDLKVGDRALMYGLVIGLMTEDCKHYKNHRRVRCSVYGSSLSFTLHNETEIEVSDKTIDTPVHANIGDRHSGWSV